MHSDKLKQAHAERARQFMPFAALTGYYDLIKEQERLIEPKRTLSSDEAERISSVLGSLFEGDYVSVVHYAKDAYLTTRGMVTKIDFEGRTLRIIKAVIPFEDIGDIEIITPSQQLP